MNTLKDYAFSLACACVAGTLFYLVIPESNLEKNVKFIINIFFLCCIVTPIANGTVNLDWNLQLESVSQSTEQRSQELYQEMERQVLDQTAVNVQKQIENELKKNKINFKKILVFVNTDDINGIGITNAEIYLDQVASQSHDRVYSIMRELLGDTVITIKEDYGK